MKKTANTEAIANTNVTTNTEAIANTEAIEAIEATKKPIVSPAVKALIDDAVSGKLDRNWDPLREAWRIGPAIFYKPDDVTSERWQKMSVDEREDCAKVAHIPEHILELIPDKPEAKRDSAKSKKSSDTVTDSAKTLDKIAKGTDEQKPLSSDIVIFHSVEYQKPASVTLASWQAMNQLEKVDCVRLSVYQSGDSDRLTSAKNKTAKTLEKLEQSFNLDFSRASVSLVKLYKAIFDRNAVPARQYFDTVDYPVTVSDCKAYASQVNKSIQGQVARYLVNSEIDGLTKWFKMLDNNFAIPKVEVTEKVDDVLDVRVKLEEFSLVKFVELTKGETVRSDFNFLSSWATENIVNASLSDVGTGAKSYLSQTAKKSYDDKLIESFSGNSNSKIMYQLKHVADRLLPEGIDRNDKAYTFTSYDVNLLKKALVTAKAGKAGDMTIGLNVQTQSVFYRFFIRILYCKVNGLGYELTTKNTIFIDKDKNK